MTITIPDHPTLESKAAAAGFETAADYVVHLVEEAAGPFRPKAASTAVPEETAFEAFERLGVIGCMADGPDDLATNPAHMEGFGRS